MRFLADMGVAAPVVTWLREQGYDAVHLRDEGLHRLPNGEIFTKAVGEGRVIVTFDLDFGEIAALARGRMASVIVFRFTQCPHTARYRASGCGSGRLFCALGERRRRFG